jgi:two-component system, sporulation sensor kinase E
MIQASLFALAFLLILLACYIWRARRGSPVNRSFALHTLTLAGWVFGIAGLQSWTYLEFWSRLTFAGASLIPAAFLSFIRTYPVPGSWPPPFIVRAGVAIGIGFGVLSLASRAIVDSVSLTPSGPTRIPGVLYPAFATYMLVGVVPALAVFVLKWLRSRGQARAQLQYLGVGLIIMTGGGFTANLLLPLLTGRSTYSWLGPFFILPMVGLVGHAIIRHRLMDLRLVVNRRIADIASTALISAVVIATLRLALPHLWKDSFEFPANVLIVGVVALLVLTVPGQQLLGTLIDPYLYRGRIEPASALRDATHRLSRLMQPKELADELRNILNHAFVPEYFAMAARPLEGGAFEELSPDARPIADLLTIAALSADAVDTVGARTIVLNPMRATGPQKAAHEALRAAGVEIVVTLGRRNQLLGVILLGPRRSGDAYFARDLSFIEAVADLASIALENSLLYRHRTQMLEYSEQLLESLNSAVVAVEISGKINSFNTASKLLLGIREESRGGSLTMLPSEVGWALALAIQGSWPPREIELTIDHNQRGTVPVILSTAVLRDEHRAIVGALVVVTDLSAVKALEQNQRRIEHLSVMARFYAGIAHEIRSPLTAISSLISMLPDRFDDPEYRDTAARLLPLEVNRIVRLAERLRLMAPSEHGKLNAVALRPLLTDITAIHFSSTTDGRVRIILQCPPDLPHILGDANQLVQLFVNLMKNGIEAMPDGGNLVVRCSHRKQNDTVLVEILDEGTGIDPSIRSSLFQPFFTTKAFGTGLGLPICREIADFHRARLSLIPRADHRGAAARVEFPLGSTDASLQASAIASGPIKPDNAKIHSTS